MSWYTAQWSGFSTTALWVWYAITWVPWRHVNIRCVASLALIWQVAECLTYPAWVKWPEAKWHVWPFHFLIMFLWFSVLATRRNGYKSDPVRKGHIHICILKPKSTRASILSVFGKPAGSVAIYAYGKLWSFVRGQNTFKARPVAHGKPLQDYYTVIDTGVLEQRRVEVELYRILGTPARQARTLWLRVNCVIVLKPVLQILGEKWAPRGFEFLPNFYARKVLN